MNTASSTNPQDYYLEEMSRITSEIVKQSGTANCIYRGEPETYDQEPFCGKVSSTLYRTAPVMPDSGKISMPNLQQGILYQVRRYIPAYEYKDKFEILTELQHYGAETNLINFTSDYSIALFFACNGFHDKDGRVILMETTDETKEKYCIREPESAQNSVLAQKSVFVQPPDGYIASEDIRIFLVPARLKQWILIHLAKIRNISTQSVFNDLHGFIRHRNLTWSDGPKRPLFPAEKTYNEMLRSKHASIEEKKQKIFPLIKAYTSAIQYSSYDATIYVKLALCYAKTRELKRAIETLTKAIYLKDDYAYAYMVRGGFYSLLKEHDRSIKDYTSVISLQPSFLPKVYIYRGREWLKLERWNNARSDLLFAKENGEEIVAEFSYYHTSVGDFEQKFGVKLPPDIAAMLHRGEPPQTHGE